MKKSGMWSGKELVIRIDRPMEAVEARAPSYREIVEFLKQRGALGIMFLT
jgi:hypothetical protein